MARDRLRPAASWLRSADPDRWAAAMARCRYGDPSACASDSTCRYGGECFRRQRPEHTAEERLDALEARVRALEGVDRGGA